MNQERKLDDVVCPLCDKWEYIEAIAVLETFFEKRDSYVAVVNNALMSSRCKARNTLERRIFKTKMLLV